VSYSRYYADLSVPHSSFLERDVEIIQIGEDFEAFGSPIDLDVLFALPTKTIDVFANNNLFYPGDSNCENPEFQTFVQFLGLFAIGGVNNEDVILSLKNETFSDLVKTGNFSGFTQMAYCVNLIRECISFGRYKLVGENRNATGLNRVLESIRSKDNIYNNFGLKFIIKDYSLKLLQNDTYTQQNEVKVDIGLNMYFQNEDETGNQIVIFEYFEDDKRYLLRVKITPEGTCSPSQQFVVYKVGSNNTNPY